MGRWQGTVIVILSIFLSCFLHWKVWIPPFPQCNHLWFCYRTQDNIFGEVTRPTAGAACLFWRRRFSNFPYFRYTMSAPNIIFDPIVLTCGQRAFFLQLPRLPLCQFCDPFSTWAGSDKGCLLWIWNRILHLFVL